MTTTKGTADSRKLRLAKALKANLARRKRQAKVLAVKPPAKKD